MSTSISLPSGAVQELAGLVVPGDGESLRMRITIDDRDVVARDFGAYLGVIDAVYGRLTSDDLLSYSLKEKEHLRIKKIEAGSLELLIEAVASNPLAVAIVISINFFLKYLPELVRAAGSSFKDFQEGALVREKRRELEARAQEDEQLAQLSPERREELVALLAALARRESRRLPAAQRFSKSSVTEVNLEMAQAEEATGEGASEGE